MPRKPKPKRRTGHLYLRGSIWWVKYFEGGKPIFESTKTSDHADAEAYLNRKLAGVQAVAHTKDAARVEMSQLFDMVVEDYKRKKRKSLYDLTKRLEQIRSWWGSLKAREITGDTIKKYERHRLKDVESGTIRRELAIVKRALNLGARHDPPLVSRVPHFDMPPEGKARQGIITAAQYSAIRDVLPAYARIALVIAYHTGARKGEILSIRVADVDLNKKTILLRQGTTKNSESRALPIYGPMAAELEIAIAAATSKRCPWLVQNDGVRVHAFRKSWATACKAAGVPDSLFHDLRRVACTNMMDAGISVPDAMVISGHKTDDIFRKYVITNQRRVQESAAKLEAFLREPIQEKRKPS